MKVSQVAPLAAAADDSRTTGRDKLLDRLVPPMPGSAFWGWAGPLLVTLFGAILRFDRLSAPRGIVFDELYYVPDSYSILRHGVELNHVKNVDKLLVHGNTHIFIPGSEYVAHPPLGKVMIAVGEWLFGLTPFGWRFVAAVIGSVSILMTARIMRRMARSTLLGCIAGLLVALDGLELMMSRTALLDIFVMFWVLAAFGMLVLDRDAIRARLAIAASGGQEASPGNAATAQVAGIASTGVSGRDMAGEPGEPGAADDAGADGTAIDAGPAGFEDPDGDEDAGGDDAFGGGSELPDPARAGPALGLRWRRVLAGLFLGCACASKWNGVWYILAFGGLAIAWDLGARRAAGFSDHLRGVLRHDAKWLPVWFGLAPFAAYLASWSGWFASSQGYDRNWAALNGNSTPIWSALDSWFQYNKSILGFGLGLSSTHTYKSDPWTWFFAYKPIVMWYTAQRTCGAPSCSQEVLAIGTPAIWWASIPALLFLVGWWVIRRDWRAGAILLAIAAGWLPWFWFAWHDHRTEFYFYAVVFLPYVVMGLTLCLGLIIGPAAATPSRRAVGACLAGTFLLAVLANLAYLYPVLTARSLPYALWHARMWFGSWIS